MAAATQIANQNNAADDGVLTLTVTTTAIPQARRGAAGFFGI